MGNSQSNEASIGSPFTHEIGRTRAHLLDVGSPKALILVPDPRSSLARGSALILSTALLKWLILLSEENTSV